MKTLPQHFHQVELWTKLFFFFSKYAPSFGITVLLLTQSFRCLRHGLTFYSVSLLLYREASVQFTFKKSLFIPEGKWINLCWEFVVKSMAVNWAGLAATQQGLILFCIHQMLTSGTFGDCLEYFALVNNPSHSWIIDSELLWFITLSRLTGSKNWWSMITAGVFYPIIVFTQLLMFK